MKPRILAMIVVGAVVLDVMPDPCAAQARGGASHASSATSPTASTATSQTRAGSGRQTGSRARVAHQRATVPVPPQFPNVATLSGPLPNTFSSPLATDQFRVHGPFRTAPLFPGYPYGVGPYSEQTQNTPPAEPPQAATGLLRFDVNPGSAQVFVDGYYFGTVDDIDKRRGLVLGEGPHRIELRRSGYDPELVDVRVVANDVVTYRGTLDAHREPPAPTAAARQAMYVVPGCYIGNVPPRPERVGSGCDVKKVRVVVPPKNPEASTPSVPDRR